MSERPEMSPRLLDAFDSLRAESAAEPEAAAMQAARAAMHRAIARQPQRHRLGLLAEHIRLALTPRRLAAAGGSLAAGLAVVSVLGWNAPAGSPLHAVRVAHESLVLSLPGSDRVALDLDYAEARMREARQQTGSWAPSLDEAGRLLDDARQHLTAGAPLWSRWENDESTLQDLRHHEHDDNATPAPGGGSDDNGGSGEEPASGSTSTGGGGGGESGSSTTSRSTTTEHESQSSSSSSVSEEHQSSTTSSTSSQSSSSSDGGGGGGGGSSSSSTSTDGGGSSGGGSDG